MILNFNLEILVILYGIILVSSTYTRSKSVKLQKITTNIELFYIAFAFAAALHTLFLLIVYTIESISGIGTFVLVK